MKHKLCTAAVCIGMLLALALPAWAAEYGEANITPQTTMNELRENPSIVGSGLYTYSREQDCTLKQAYWGTQDVYKRQAFSGLFCQLVDHCLHGCSLLYSSC